MPAQLPKNLIFYILSPVTWKIGQTGGESVIIGATMSFAPAMQI